MEGTSSTSPVLLLRGCPNRPSTTTGSSEIRAFNLQEGVFHEQTTRPESRRHFVSGHLKAMQLNYVGVSILQSGKDDDKAIALFKKSLACIKCDLAAENSSKTTSLTEEKSPEPPPRATKPCWSKRHGLDDEELTRTNPGSTNGPLVASPSLESSNGHHHVDHPMIVPMQVHEPSSLDDNLFVYTKAFVFQPCLHHGEPGHHFHNISCPCSMVDSEMLSATIIYNLGLGLHIKGVRTKSSLLKQRSLSLYEMSVGLFRRILNGNNNNNNINSNDDDNHFVNVNVVDPAHPSVTNAICTSLLIACSNNIGHLLYYLQDDYERSRRTMSNLKFLLNRFWAGLIRESRGATGLESTRSRSSSLSMFPLEHADIQGFIWNIRFMHPPTFAPAA